MSTFVKNHPYAYMGVKQNGRQTNEQYQVSIAIPVNLTDTVTAAVTLQTVGGKRGAKVTCEITSGRPSSTDIAIQRTTPAVLTIGAADVDTDGELEIVVEVDGAATFKNNCNLVFANADALGQTDLTTNDPIPMLLVQQLTGRGATPKYTVDMIVIGEIEANDVTPVVELTVAGKPARKVKIPPKPVHNL